jgi:hypothetical protein
MLEDSPHSLLVRESAVSLDQLRQVATRLQTELRAVLALVPPQHRATTDLARWLHVSRPVCHWIKAAADFTGDVIEIYALLPGIDGLDAMLRALRKRVATPHAVDAAMAAALVYRETIGAAGGSQAKLRRLVDQLREQELAGLDRDPEWHKREKMFSAMSAICGERSRLLTMVMITSPTDDPTKVSHLAALGHAAATFDPGHIPLVLSRRLGTDAGGQDETIDGDAVAGFSPGAVLGRFSSLPLPVVTTRENETSLMQTLDTRRTSGRALDIFIGRRTTAPHPDHDGTGELRFSLVPRVPTRELLMDIYVHRSLQAGPPIGLARLLGIDSAAAPHPEKRWFDQIGANPPVIPLSKCAHAGHQRHEELTNFLFEQLTSPMSEYAGWRLAVPFPLWSVQYIMKFDFPGPASKQT